MVPQVGGKPKAPQQLRSRKSAKQKEIDSQIKELNSKIKEKSAVNKERLSEKDPLIEQRQCLFRAKHERETHPVTPQSGEGRTNP